MSTTYTVAKLSREAFDAMGGNVAFGAKASGIAQTFEDRETVNAKGESRLELASVQASNRVLNMARTYAKKTSAMRLAAQLDAMSPRAIREHLEDNPFAACHVVDTVFVIAKVLDASTDGVKSYARQAGRNANDARQLAADSHGYVKQLDSLAKRQLAAENHVEIEAGEVAA